jgi:hypothetical protein
MSNEDLLCGLVVIAPGYISRGPGFDSRHYYIFWVVVSLEEGPLSLMSAIEELLVRNSSRECSRGDLLHWPRETLYLQN